MTDYLFGRDVRFGYAKETAFNESWGSPTLIGLYVDPPDVVPNIAYLKAKTTDGKATLNVADVCQGVRGWTCRIAGKIPKEGIGWLMLGLFGKVVTSGVGPYDHTFQVSVNTPPSFKLLVRQAVDASHDDYQLRGGMVKAVEFVHTPNTIPRFTAEWIGATFGRVTPTTAPTIPKPASADPFWKPGDYQSSSPVISKVLTHTGWNSFSMRIENTLTEDIEESYDIGSIERERLERAATEEAFTFKITAKRVINEDSFDLVDGFEDFVSWVCGANLLVSGQHGLSITGQRAKILSHLKTPRGLGLVEEILELEVLEESGQLISSTLTDESSDPPTQGT